MESREGAGDDSEGQKCNTLCVFFHEGKADIEQGGPIWLKENTAAREAKR